MEIYIVQPGDTVESIVNKTKIPNEKFVFDNNILPNFNLVNGQQIILAYPKQTYKVVQDDTLRSIATKNEITVLQLLQNNPSLFGREYLEVGEELVISYDKHDYPIEIDAYCFSHIQEEVLRKSLPYLTYLTIVGYRVNAFAEIETPDSKAIIQMAKEYGTAPIMLLSTFSQQGLSSYGITNKIFNNEDLQNKLISNILNVLKVNGFYGINFGFQDIIPDDLQNYINFIRKAKELLQVEGYLVFATLEPNTFGFTSNDSTDSTYYSQIGEIADAVVLLTYQWTGANFPTFEQTTIPFLKSYIEYAVTQISPEKILVGYTRIAYDWELPYVEGKSPVASLTYTQAITLASAINATINYEENYVTPYFNYDKDGIQHFVWFKDARTINAILDLITQYQLKGISVWNIMYYTPQLWTTFNSQYSIKKVLETADYLK